ncbi:MAG TPA: amino acid permease, partial [Thermoleophilaceae bacterium]|nr:amino acid permease [Thermoleophilaceae bacterium]
RLARTLERPAPSSRHGVTRGLDARSLLAIGLAALGASTYFALGVVAGRALGLAPVAFLAAAGFFVVTVMTYLEGNTLHPERGGASTLARYALDELWSFVAGWAILLDYLIVMAIGAFTVPHYLAAFWEPAGWGGIEVLVAGAVLALVAWSNVRGVTADGLARILRIGVLNVVVSLAIIAVGTATMFEPGVILGTIDLGTAPTVEDLVFAAVFAAAAVTGIEAASGLAGEVRIGRPALKRVVAAATGFVLVLLVGMSIVALVAVPVTGGVTELGGPFVEAPVLGVASALEPAWFAEVTRYAVALLGAVVLFVAVNANMLGLSRLSYSLATNRQVPSIVGRLHPERSTPQMAILIACVLALILAATSDLDLLAGVFAFGAMLAFAIAHVSVIVLRFREPDAPRPFRVPLSVRVGGGSVPVPAVLGALAAIAAWVSVVVLHDGGQLVGAAWMVAGLVLYLVYRRQQDKPLRKRFTIPADVLREGPPLAYGSILVPVFGRSLDDDIVGTAGRLAAEEDQAGEDGTVIEAIYILQMPMSLPIDARVPEERLGEARRALARAKEVGEEYEGVQVATATTRGRSVGETIVEEARRRGVEAIVLAAEEPTRTRGGALLGGRGGPRDRVAGDVTQYVMEKAPCRVVLTAPPAGEEGTREGVAP